MYGAENTISVSTVFRYAPLRMINAGFQSSPGSTICGDAKEGRKEVKGEETDPEHEGKVHAKQDNSILLYQVVPSASKIEAKILSEF